ncbi:cytochrome c oxidase subunit II [Natrialbaceae archaeon A-CW3]
MTRVDVFEDIFLVFLGLGTLVGIIVVTYTLYNAYKYRDTGDRDPDEDLPTLGELPTGGTGGKKLFVSFFLSAIIVISLVLWTYGMLLYVEDGPDDPGEDAIEVDVEGFAFGWNFYYENGVESSNEMVVPVDTPIWIEVTATDVWHAFGISEKRVKADAIPGERDVTWFTAEEEGEFLIECFELCGPGHSAMEADLIVMSEADYEEWLEEQLTLTVDLEDADGEAVTDADNVEVTLSSDDEVVATFTGDDFEDGVLEITVEQGDEYTLTVEATDDSFETVEEDVEIVDGPSETVTLEEPGEDDDNGNDDEENDDEDDDEDTGGDD